MPLSEAHVRQLNSMAGIIDEAFNDDEHKPTVGFVFVVFPLGKPDEAQFVANGVRTDAQHSDACSKVCEILTAAARGSDDDSG